MFLRGVEVHDRHGVDDFERQQGQWFIVDVDWWSCTARAIAADKLQATLCYKRLYDCVIAITAYEPWRHLRRIMA